MKLEVLGEKGGVADEREREADTDDDSNVQRIGQQAPTSTRHVYHTVIESITYACSRTSNFTAGILTYTSSRKRTNECFGGK